MVMGGVLGFLDLRTGKITKPGKDKEMSTKAFILSYVPFHHYGIVIKL